MKTRGEPSWRACFDILHGALLEAQGQRDKRGYVTDGEIGWVTYEREVMRSEVNRLRVGRGLPLVDPAVIAAAERSASGHFDYTKKFALYCADAVMGA